MSYYHFRNNDGNNFNYCYRHKSSWNYGTVKGVIGNG